MSLTFEDITRRLTKVGRLRKENEAALAASIARIERNLEDKVDNMFKHLVTAYIVLEIVELTLLFQDANFLLEVAGLPWNQLSSKLQDGEEFISPTFKIRSIVEY